MNIAGRNTENLLTEESNVEEKRHLNYQSLILPGMSLGKRNASRPTTAKNKKGKTISQLLSNHLSNYES